MEDVLKILNSYSSKFQIKVVIVISLIFSVIGMHMFTFVYMFLTPDFMSLDQNPQSTFSMKTNFLELSEQEACTRDFKTSVSFESITSEYELYCERGYIKEFGEFLLMVTASVMSMFLSVIQDTMGRKMIILLSFFCLSLDLPAHFLETPSFLDL